MSTFWQGFQSVMCEALESAKGFIPSAYHAGAIAALVLLMFLFFWAMFALTSALSYFL